MYSNPWLFDEEVINKTPSIKAGLSKTVEHEMRTEGTRFIQKIGAQELNLHHCTVATGAVYFHRFYMYHTFTLFPMYPMAAACLFLAGKAEETPKKSHDIIKVCRGVLSNDDYATFTANGLEPKEELLTLERILLQTLRFDLEVEHPYDHLIKYVGHLKIEASSGLEASSLIRKELTQSAWTFLNDSCCTTICLQYEPEIIAIAMLLLSCKIRGFRIVDWDNKKPEHNVWWDAYVENLDDSTLENICHKLLDLYDAQNEQNKFQTTTE